ncbi:Ropporin-1-like protein [Phlyctochytrium bullatum]|nr:Ropporin-1-like protein [Phlyctochytrium bullatum]
MLSSAIRSSGGHSPVFGSGSIGPTRPAASDPPVAPSTSLGRSRGPIPIPSAGAASMHHNAGLPRSVSVSGSVASGSMFYSVLSHHPQAEEEFERDVARSKGKAFRGDPGPREMTDDVLTSVSGREPLYCAEQIKIPPDLPDILKNYTKHIIRSQPADILACSAE